MVSNILLIFTAPGEDFPIWPIFLVFGWFKTTNVRASFFETSGPRLESCGWFQLLGLGLNRRNDRFYVDQKGGFPIDLKRFIFWNISGLELFVRKFISTFFVTVRNWGGSTYGLPSPAGSLAFSIGQRTSELVDFVLVEIWQGLEGTKLWRKPTKVAQML